MERFECGWIVFDFLIVVFLDCVLIVVFCLVDCCVHN